MTTTVRVSDRTHKAIRQLARDNGLSMQAAIDTAVEAYRRRLIFDQSDAAFTALRADPAAWANEQAERRTWGV